MSKHAVWIAAFATTILVGTARPAHADQCALVTKKVADFASSILRSGTGAWIEYCEPCGDKPPTKYSTHAKTIEVRKSGAVAGYYELLINNKAVDLAYIYVSVGDYNKFTNLGIQAGCGATDVSPTYEMSWNKPADPLAGTWTLTDETTMSTCSGDPIGSRTADTWTITVADDKLTVKNKLGIVFTGDKGGVITLAKPGKKSIVAYQLTVQDKAMTGQRLAATLASNRADPICVTSHTVTAKKQ